MSDMTGFAGFFYGIFEILSPFLALAIMALGYWAVAELKKRGYQVTYATAIVRAMGAGVMAAQDKGLDPFAGAGRSLVISVGTDYLRQHVGEAAEQLGINDLHLHAAKIDAQLGVVAAQAEAVAQASAIKVAAMLPGATTTGI